MSNHENNNLSSYKDALGMKNLYIFAYLY